MQITNDEQRVLVRALELAIKQVPLEDGTEFRNVLDKLQGVYNQGDLDGFRYDYTDNI